MQIIQQDLLEVSHGVCCQQVNCQGVFGKGLALATRTKFPQVANAYFEKGDWRLGDCVFVEVAPGLYHALLAGQDRYGKGQCFTDYPSLESCLQKVTAFAEPLRLPVFIPYGIGCGLAGGDWQIVSAIIKRVCPDAYVCRKL